MPRTTFRNAGDDGAGSVFGGEVGYEPRDGGVECSGAETGEFGDECFSACEGC